MAHNVEINRNVEYMVVLKDIFFSYYIVPQTILFSIFFATFYVVKDL